MNEISQSELSRQSRVLNQTISIHSMLRDKYSKRALTLDIMLLVCSIIFCATTFSSNELYSILGLEPKNSRFWLGIVSIIAFMAAIISLRVDWKGKAAEHKDAVKKLTETLKLYRENKGDNDIYLKEKMHDLNNSYWETMKNIVEISDRQFNTLKARHIRKVMISKLSDKAEGCPIFLIRIIVIVRAMINAFKNNSTSHDKRKIEYPK